MRNNLFIHIQNIDYHQENHSPRITRISRNKSTDLFTDYKKSSIFRCLACIELLYKDLTGKIVDCAVKVHKQLGPGLLESAYEECLYQELLDCGISAIKQVPMPLIYNGRKLELGYRLDLLVEDKE